MEYEDMDDAVEQPSATVIPFALAGLGIVLGIAGLYFGFTAKQELNVVKASMQENTVSGAQVEKAFVSVESQIAELEELVTTQANQINRLRVYSNQREQDLKKIVSEWSKYRGQIEANARQLQTFKQSAAAKPSAKKSASGQADAADYGAGASATSSRGAQVYKIMSGDTFSKIAARFGVTVEAIIDANPEADPRRLAIDQEIIIPAK